MPGRTGGVRVPTRPTANVKAARFGLTSRVSFVAAVALVLRFGVLWWTWHRAAPAAPHAPYGYELGSVAKAIASGKGFSSPLPFFDTGPTAWLSPLFPYIVGGIFKIWGIYSAKSHLAIQIFNCLCSAFTIFPTYAIAKRSFGTNAAVGASWLWAVLPTAWHVPVADVWDTSLSALWFALLFWAGLALRGERSTAKWAGYGALWAVGALINTSLAAVLPFFFLWLAWEGRKGGTGWLRPVAIASIVFALGLAPWTIRNYFVFGRLVPVRSVLGITLWMGNNAQAVGIDSFPLLPTLNLGEAERFREMGEVNYARVREREAFAFMRAHPATTARHILRDFASFWLAVTDRADEKWSTDPLYVKGTLVANGLVVLLCVVGFTGVWRLEKAGAVPYAIILGVFPIVYYVTYPLVRFRFPIEPILAVLAVQGALYLGGRGKWPDEHPHASAP